MSTETLYPNSDDAVTGFIGYPDNTNLYTNVDEGTTTHDSDSTYVEGEEVFSIVGIRFGLTNPTLTGPFNRIDIRGVARTDVAAVCQLSLYVLGSSVGSQTFNTTTSYTLFSFSINGNWTKVELNSSQLEFDSSGTAVYRLTACDIIIYETDTSFRVRRHEIRRNVQPIWDIMW